MISHSHRTLEEVVAGVVMFDVAVAVMMYVVVISVMISVAPSSIDMRRLAEHAMIANVVVRIHPYQPNSERKLKDVAAKFLCTCMDACTVVHTCRVKMVEGAMVVTEVARLVILDADIMMAKMYACQLCRQMMRMCR
uniref:Uncharacterized protein n=1 Tax=Cannabis sativa TaxID=3483 RepID=A0A803QEC3_CANSA